MLCQFHICFNVYLYSLSSFGEVISPLFHELRHQAERICISIFKSLAYILSRFHPFDTLIILIKEFLRLSCLCELEEGSLLGKVFLYGQATSQILNAFLGFCRQFQLFFYQFTALLFLLTNLLFKNSLYEYPLLITLHSLAELIRLNNRALKLCHGTNGLSDLLF